MVKDSKLEVETLKIQLKKSTRQTQNVSNYGDRSEYQEEASAFSAQTGDMARIVNKVNF